MKMMRGLSVLAVLTILVASAGADTVFFLSDKGFGEGAAAGNPSLSLTPGQTTSLYLWVQPDRHIVGADLAVESTDPAVLEGVAVTVFNPDIWIDALAADSGEDRWQSTLAGAAGGDIATTLGGVSVTEGFGLDPGLDGTVTPFLYRDVLYDAVPDAYLFAQIDIQATGGVGSSTDLYIVVGSGLVSPEGGALNPMPVRFGVDEPLVIQGNDQQNAPGQRSDVADGTVTIIPEPATMVLLGVGVLGLSVRKRR